MMVRPGGIALGSGGGGRYSCIITSTSKREERSLRLLDLRSASRAPLPARSSLEPRPLAVAPPLVERSSGARVQATAVCSPILAATRAAYGRKNIVLACSPLLRAMWDTFVGRGAPRVPPERERPRAIPRAPTKTPPMPPEARRGWGGAWGADGLRPGPVPKLAQPVLIWSNLWRGKHSPAMTAFDWTSTPQTSPTRTAAALTASL